MERKAHPAGGDESRLHGGHAGTQRGVRRRRLQTSLPRCARRHRADVDAAYAVELHNARAFFSLRDIWLRPQPVSWVIFTHPENPDDVLHISRPHRRKGWIT